MAEKKTVLREDANKYAESDINVTRGAIQAVAKMVRIPLVQLDYDHEREELKDALDRGQVIPESVVQQVSFQVLTKYRGRNVVLNCVDTGTMGRDGFPLVILKGVLTPERAREILQNEDLVD